MPRVRALNSNLGADMVRMKKCVVATIVIKEAMERTACRSCSKIQSLKALLIKRSLWVRELVQIRSVDSISQPMNIRKHSKIKKKPEEFFRTLTSISYFIPPTLATSNATLSRSMKVEGDRRQAIGTMKSRDIVERISFHNLQIKHIIEREVMLTKWTSSVPSPTL